MRIARRFARKIGFGVVALALTFSGCGDDKGSGSGNSNGDSGTFGEIADDLTAAESNFLDANAAIYASANYFGPSIVAALSSPGASAASVQTSCLPAAAVGQIFEFDGSSYLGVPDAGVPANGARFRLYQITQAGTPNLSQAIGYIDVICTQDPQSGTVASINIALGAVTVLSLTGEMPSFGLLTVTGMMRGSSGTPTMQVQGSAVLSPDVTIAFILPGSFIASYVEMNPSSQDAHLVADVAGPGPNIDWELFATANYNSSDNVTSGYATYHDESKSGIVACVSSGTRPSPAFSAPAASCANGDPLLSSTSAERQAMADGLKSLRALWLSVNSFIELGLAVVVTP